MNRVQSTMEVQRLVVGPYENNVYVVTCNATGKAALIDASAEPEVILAATEGFEVLEILVTHGHADHIGAIDHLTSALGSRWRMHPADAPIAGREPPLPLEPDAIIPIGTLRLRTLHTPGHTPGSCSIVVGGALFTGDTLFPGGPGATRWEYSDFPLIMDSLESKLFSLPDDTVVYPGHGEPTTIGTERPHLAEWRARGW